MNTLEFYELTNKKLKAMAKERGIKNLEKYFTLTDFQAIPQLSELDEIGCTFAQIAFHGQNATLISNIIKFRTNFDYIKELTCGYRPKDFLESYKDANTIVEKLRNDGTITWNIAKSSKKPDMIVIRYAKLLLDAARYLKRFENKEAVLADLKKHNTNSEDLIRYFRKQIKSGFSVALSCDFLKEYDTCFSNLPKPDIHIKDVLTAYNGHPSNYYNSEKKEYECIREMQEIVREINENTQSDAPLTVYKLDRMIWLICAGNFYLDVAGNDKDEYLKSIRDSITP